MEKQSHRRSMSKGDEWILLEEKIYRLQGAKPKAKRHQGLPAIGPNPNEKNPRGFTSSDGRHFQENKSPSKLKSPKRCPQELISVGNMSLVTARQGNKILYRRAISSPLPVLSPSKRSPSRVSPSPRTPTSAPARMISAFQWPPIEGNKEQRSIPEAGETERRMNAMVEKTSVHLPPIQPQQHRVGESMKTHCDPRYEELGAIQEDEDKRGHNLSEDFKDGVLLARRKFEEECRKSSTLTRKTAMYEELDTIPEDEDKTRPNLSEDLKGAGMLARRKIINECRKAPTLTRKPGIRCSITGKQESEEVFQVKEDSSGTSNSKRELRNAVNRDREVKQISLSEPGLPQGTEEDMSSLMQENGREMKKATIKSKKGLERRIDTGERRQKNFAPQRKRRRRFLRTESQEPIEFNEQSEVSLEQDDFVDVFVIQPVPSSRAQRAVSGLPQKTMSVDTPERAAHQGKNHSKNMIDLCHAASELSVLNGIGPRSFSPDSFVAQLIANTEKLILNDSTESPALQERKKLARKKFY